MTGNASLVAIFLLSLSILSNIMCLISQFAVINTKGMSNEESLMGQKGGIKGKECQENPSELSACNQKVNAMHHKCPYCDNLFSSAGNLKMHVKTHSGEKSKKCNQCDYAFTHASSLRAHLKTHSGERSNKCNQCHFACCDANSLRRHI